MNTKAPASCPHQPEMHGLQMCLMTRHRPDTAPKGLTGAACGRISEGMADASFDALAVSRQLKAKGFDSNQAEAITEAVRTGVTGGVATKADLAELEIRQTWRTIIGGLALNSVAAAAVIAAVGWMLAGG